MCIFCEKKKFLCLSAHVPYKQILVSIHRTAPLSVYCFTVHSNTDNTLVKCIPLPGFYNNQGGVFFIQHLLGQIPSFAVAIELPPNFVVFRVKQGVLRTSSIPCHHGMRKAYRGPVLPRVLTGRVRRTEDQFYSVSSRDAFGLQTASLRTVGCIHFVCCI